MNIFTVLENLITKSVLYLPLGISVFLGGFIEEVVAPIPASVVMIAMGSFAFAQHKGLLDLVWLSVLGSAGKSLGAWIVYDLSDKFGDKMVGKFGHYFGVSHKDVENIGRRFIDLSTTKHKEEVNTAFSSEKKGRYTGLPYVLGKEKASKGGKMDMLILFLLRATTIVPSAAISIVSGLIKIDLRMYLAASFAGNIIRCLIYIYIGYAGILAAQSAATGIHNFETWLQILLLVIVAGTIGWFYYKKKRRAPMISFKK